MLCGPDLIRPTEDNLLDSFCWRDLKQAWAGFGTGKISVAGFEGEESHMARNEQYWGTSMPPADRKHLKSQLSPIQRQEM